jgi:serine/threonine-protein kinase
MAYTRPDVSRGNRTSREGQVVGVEVDDPTALTVAPAPTDGPTQVYDSIAPPPSRADDTLAIGELIGEYRVEAKIGEGGMGVVYAAVHPRIGKRAAVKVLRRELCADASQVRRFLDEARVVNEIGHPNIVDVFAFGEMADGRCYFVMEWLKGCSLRERLDAGTPTLAETCAIVRPLCRALQAAHAAKIIHRDLKPDNIFLVEVRDEQPVVKLLDFGIAKLQHSDHGIAKTATGAMVGTPQYIAPEQARGYTIDHTVDTYSLGGILFEMITGRPPFLADNAMDVVAKHLLEIPPRLSTLVADVPYQLDSLVAAMLDKDPARRPSLATVQATIDAVATAQRDSRASLPRVAFTLTDGVGLSAAMPPVASAPMGVVAAPTNTVETGATPRSRSPVAYALLAGCVVVAAIVAFAIVSYGSNGEPPAARESIQRRQLAAPPVDAAVPTPAQVVSAPAPAATAPVDAAVPSPPAPTPTPAVATKPAPQITHHVQPPASHVQPKPPPPPKPPTPTIDLSGTSDDGIVDPNHHL